MRGARPVFFALGLFCVSSLARAQDSVPAQGPSVEASGVIAEQPLPEPRVSESDPVAQPSPLPAPAPVPPLPAAPSGVGSLSAPSDGSSLRVRLDEVDARLAEIRRERPGVAGPIVMTAVGGGVAIAGGYLALLSWAFANADGDECGYDGYRDPECEDAEDDERAFVRGLGVIALSGLAVSIGGVVWMGRRFRERSVYKPEVRELKRQRRELLQDLRFGVVSERDRLGLRLGASF